MKSKTEEAFKIADHSARLLADMKHGIYEIKIAGGIDEKEKLEALMGFQYQAQDILKNMGDAIGEAIYEIDQENKTKKENSDAFHNTSNFSPRCDFCDFSYPTHEKGCPRFVDMRMEG